MQVVIGRGICSSLGCRSGAYQFNPIQSGSFLSERSFQHFPGHQSSQCFTRRSWRPRICVPVVRLSPSSHAVEKVDVVVESSDPSWNTVRSLALLVNGGIPIISTAAARAEEVVVDTSAQTTEGAADTVLGFLFTAAFVGLTIVTIGVIYLSVTDWLEKRERDALGKAAGPEQEKLGAPVKDEVERFAPKGFGKKVAKAEKEKKVEQKR